MIEQSHAKLSITRQCELLGISRSGYYYTPKGVSEYDLELMETIDKEYLKRPVLGSRKMRYRLKDLGYQDVGRRRIRRLMGIMGLEAIYPKRSLSVPEKEHKKYPYLLRGLDITRPNQVWATDITYIRLHRGFAYLVAFMDWYSRYVLSWELSATMETESCLRALEAALKISTPEISNSDQGSQFTSNEFTGRLEEAGIKVSMDGRGRVFDNIMIERLWRSVKYEEVYIKDYSNMIEARQELRDYFDYYNNERRHDGIGGKTPAEAYVEGHCMTSVG